MYDVALGVLWWLAVLGVLALFAVAILAAFGVIEIGPLHIVVHNQ